MGWKWKRQGAAGVIGCWIFLLGLVIGLTISYGIRLLSSKSVMCQAKVLKSDVSYDSVQNPTPDQILNLAFSNSRKTSINEKEKPESDFIKDTSMTCSEIGNCMKEKSTSKEPFQGKKNKIKARELLFVGVMTANSYIGSRAKAVWETWAQEIPGKVVFFTGGNSYVNEGVGNSNYPEENVIQLDTGRKSVENDSIPLVALPGVDDSYPPQKKSFMMLEYMYNHYGDDYEWFMRADDDVYVRSDKLAEFLRSIDSRHLHFIGQAGKGNQVERGTLNLAHNENFCMGGPGIIMSQPTLAKVAPKVHDCLRDMYSTHEDVEVGRCVQRYAGISCTWAYEMQSIFYHNSTGERAFTGKLKRKEVHKAMTLHPIKNHQHLYRLHSYFQSLKIQDLLYETVLLHRDLVKFGELINGGSGNSASRDFSEKNWISNKHDFNMMQNWEYNVTGLPTSLNKFVPRVEKDILSWDFISKGIYSTDTISPKQKMKGDGKEALEDVVRELMEIINGFSRSRGRIIDFKEVLYGYKRVNPLHGADYILDILMTYKKYRGRKMTIPVRRHVYIQRPFGPLQLRNVVSSGKGDRQSLKNSKEFDREGNPKNNYTEPSKHNNSKRDATNLVMIVPLSGRFGTFQRFLESFSVSCTELRKSFHENNSSRSNSSPFPNDFLSIKSYFELNLVVVFFGSDMEKEKFLELVKNTRENLTIGAPPNDHLSCNIRMVQIDGDFSRAVALETGISQCNEEDLLFLIDVDLTFTASALRHVHLNTIQGKQVYFPVVFSQYNPSFYSRSISKISLEADNNENLDPKRAAAPKGDYKRKSEDATEPSDNKMGSDSDMGYWRDFGYGIAGLYKSDFRLAGGFDTSIKGWGKEDVALFDRFVLHTNLTIFRAPDPHLVHVFHETICDPHLSPTQHEMCLGSQANTLGSTSNLMNYIFQHKSKSVKFQNIMTAS